MPFDQGEFVYDPEKECFNFQKEYQKSVVDDDEFIFSSAQQLEDSDIENIKDDDHQHKGSDISQVTSSVTPMAGIGRCDFRECLSEYM